MGNVSRSKLIERSIWRKSNSFADAPTATEPKLTKGQRTREKIKLGASEVLEAKGYHDIMVKDVTEQVGIANGLFYHYFKDIHELSMGVLTEFAEAFSREAAAVSMNCHPFEFIYRQNLIFAKRFKAHPGLMRCMIQASDDSPDFTEIWLKTTNTWNKQRIQLVREHLGEDLDEAVRRIWALGSMTDGYLSEYYLRRNPELRKSATSTREIAFLTADAWYRGVFLETPPQDLVKKLTKANRRTI